MHSNYVTLLSEVEEHVTTWGGGRIRNKMGIVNEFLEFHVIMYTYLTSSKKDFMNVTYEKPSYMLKNNF